MQKIFLIITLYCFIPACQIFPELIGQEFQFNDVDGALISQDFFPAFLNFSTIGVILNIKSDSTQDIGKLQSLLHWDCKSYHKLIYL